MAVPLCLVQASLANLICQTYTHNLALLSFYSSQGKKGSLPDNAKKKKEQSVITSAGALYMKLASVTGQN